MKRSKDYDVIIVGGGHNGLVAGGYLAGAGLQVVVIERLERLGGPGARIEFIPGFWTSVSNSPGSLEPQIVRDLELERFGLRFVKPDPTLVHPLNGGRLFLARRDKESTARQLEAFAAGESRRYDALFSYLGDFARRLGISIFREPPSLRELVRNLSAPEDDEAFARVFFGSAQELLDLFLTTEEAKAIVGMLASVSGPGSAGIPGTVMNLMMRPLSLAETGDEAGYDPRKLPLRGSTGLPLNGMGAVIEAMARSFQARGGTIQRACEAAALLCDVDRVKGVATVDGREFRAPIVISAISPQRAVMDLAPSNGAWLRYKELMAAKHFRGKACKVVLALDGPPVWVGQPGDGEISPQALASAQFRIAPTTRYLDEAYAEVLLGRIPHRPVIWGLVPSMTSPDLAPAGCHIMSLNVGAPLELSGEDWSTGRELMVKRCVDALEPWMPGLAQQIVGYRCLAPSEFVDDFGLPGAEICHGHMLPGNQFWMRPLPGLHRYRTPTQGFYLSGAGTWPGNFFSGIPGHNASHAVLRDLETGQVRLTS
ncbi:MAG: phytoene desaturase family protein [Acetobacteraceae bacterium]